MRKAVFVMMCTALLACGAAWAKDEARGPALFKNFYFGQPKTDVLAKGAQVSIEDGEEYLVLDSVEFAGKKWTQYHYFTKEETLRAVALIASEDVDGNATAAMNTLLKSGFACVLLDSGGGQADIVALLRNKKAAEVQAEAAKVAFKVTETGVLTSTYIDAKIFSTYAKKALNAQHLIALMPPESRVATVSLMAKEGEDGYAIVSFTFPRKEMADAVKEAGGGKEDF